MILRMHQPGPPLAGIVDHMVYFSGHQPGYNRERVIPDTGVYLIIDLDDEPKHVYDNHHLTEIQSCRKSWLSGVHKGYLTIEAGNDSTMLVIKFRPGGAHALFNLPLKELSNLVIDSDLIFGSAIHSLRDALLEAATPEAKFVLAEKFILARVQSHLAIHKAVQYAVGELSRQPAGITINRVHFETGISRKHLAELFARWVGVTPKYYQRIVRFQSVLGEIERDHEISWPGLAIDCGYYDQAHFIKEFKHFCGMNPSDYLVDKGEHLGYIPIR